MGRIPKTITVITSKNHWLAAKALNVPQGFWRDTDATLRRVVGMQSKLHDIEQLLEDGKTEEAINQLESFLELGPNNIHALKLKAQAFQKIGAFEEETALWSRVARIDAHDEDLRGYLEQRSREESEYLYFTEDDGQGGRVFYGYSRMLTHRATLGFMGCLLFLTYSKLATTYLELGKPLYLLITFSALVLAPWVFIVRAYLGSLHSVTLNKDGVAFRGRMKKVFLKWEEMTEITVIPSGQADDHQLSLLFKAKDGSSVNLNIAPHSTPIRGRMYFIHEIKARCPRLSKFLRLMPGEKVQNSSSHVNFRW